MKTKHSEVGSLPARDGGAGASHSVARFVTQLGDVKVETRYPTGSDNVDNVNPVEFYAD